MKAWQVVLLVLSCFAVSVVGVTLVMNQRDAQEKAEKKRDDDAKARRRMDDMLREIGNPSLPNNGRSP